MATTNDFRNGLCIELNNDLFTIIEFQHVKPGKGNAFVRTKLRSLTKGKVIDYTFSAGIKITTARVERRPYQFLYKDHTGHHFMNNESFDQIILKESLINAPQLLKEGQEVEITLHQDAGTILNCTLPPFVNLQVMYTEPGCKGDTATRALKAATLETGVEIRVPLFINKGDLLKVDTRKKLYVERINEKKI